MPISCLRILFCLLFQMPSNSSFVNDWMRWKRHDCVDKTIDSVGIIICYGHQCRHYGLLVSPYIIVLVLRFRHVDIEKQTSMQNAGFSFSDAVATVFGYICRPLYSFESGWMWCLSALFDGPVHCFVQSIRYIALIDNFVFKLKFNTLLEQFISHAALFDNCKWPQNHSIRSNGRCRYNGTHAYDKKSTHPHIYGQQFTETVVAFVGIGNAARLFNAFH